MKPISRDDRLRRCEKSRADGRPYEGGSVQTPKKVAANGDPSSIDGS